MDTRSLGRMGEELAKLFLEKEGYQIIEENFWCRYGEIDLIALQKDYLVFIEVKLSSNKSYMNPQEKVDYRKQKKLEQVARYYLSNKQVESDFRFDVVAISGDKRDREIELFKNAFYC
ncbi:putative endonuclease [Orenia metallireducens]|uniref:UPF0102 protein SAMN06265827_12013 n=1 Tax=Orenia metallireducens TaxID=1413210 RepID=A0A285HJC2_9FIRM|nr:YraN family protein [Orenia metallireducens]PRX26649.1 putative endonuclease [Orenia metallireducens]SNY35839.1 putative endonuclease [Orenia metallireducens]